MARGRLLLTTTLALALAIPAGASASVPPVPPPPTAPGSLPSVNGQEPGPKILYKKPPKPAPQLRNRGPWKAKPLLVSGASAYVKGEFIYQDYLFDDHGAQAPSRDPSDPRTGDDAFSAPNGTYTYPTDVKRYRNNVADLVEFRVKPAKRSTYFRLTFNSMTKPKAVATTIALGDSPEAYALPGNAGVSAPAENFLLVRGGRVQLMEADDDLANGIVSIYGTNVSKKRRQISFQIPRQDWNPKRSTVRMAAATGLWRGSLFGGGYLQPGTSATATEPGGGAGLADPSAIANVAFRFDEPLPDVQDPGVLTDTAWWREKAQGDALAQNDISPFFAEVDFAKLRDKETDRMKDEPTGVPTTGPINRIFTTRLAKGQGVQFEFDGCGSIEGCRGQFLGKLQPYSLYVPDKPEPPRGRGLTLLLHSLGATYNQFHGSRNQSQFGDRDQGSIVLTTLNGGPDGWYYGRAGAETFEAWADVARRYRLDPSRTAITGYSMGGYATYKLGVQFPDLFAAGQPTVGPPGLGVWVPGTPAEPEPGSNTNAMLASLRHVPFQIWNGVEDELVPYPGALEQGQTFGELGLPSEFRSYPTAEHFTFALNDQYDQAAEFLGDRRVVKNPALVEYVRNDSMDFRKLGFVADHAYWLSKVRTLNSKKLGTVRAFSQGFGEADVDPASPTPGAGALTGGFLPALAFTSQTVTPPEPPQAPRRDRLELKLKNVGHLAIDPKRARISCNARIDVDSNKPVAIKLLGCGSTSVYLPPTADAPNP